MRVLTRLKKLTSVVRWPWYIFRVIWLGALKARLETVGGMWLYAYGSCASLMGGQSCVVGYQHRMNSITGDR